jgi:hypothetical protein
MNESPIFLSLEEFSNEHTWDSFSHLFSIQVHPYKLTNAFMDAAKDKGAKVVQGNVQRVVYEEGGDHQVKHFPS